MDPTIHLLSEAVADQIAAGEVVERPASVVKELLENALDAGAGRITVEVAEGGRRLLRVIDDGSGMSPIDARRCVQRHATSKLTKSDELFSLETLGFRGEALPSIASVSRFELRTKLRGAVVGTQVTVDGGAPAEISEIGCPHGTTVSVRDLFYNVPARLSFLRAKATENGQISAVCLRTALAHPDLQLTLVREGRTAREWLRAGSLAERVQEAFPGERLTTIEEAADGLQVHAVLGPPERARSGATGLHLFVNSRPVRDTSLARAVAFAYGSVLPPGRYPIGAVHVHLPADEVDVNVHPQKTEVRLRDGRRRYDALTRMLAKALGLSAWRGPSARPPQSYWAESLRGAAPLPDGGHTARAVADLQKALDTVPAAAGLDAQRSSQADPWGLGPFAAPRTPRADTPEQASEPAQAPVPLPDTEAGHFGRMRVLGQVRRMFLVCEGQDGVYLLDQHAADERIRYDQLRRAHREGRVKTQALLFPERVECSEREAALLETHREEVARAGLECSLLGPTTVAVHAIPVLLARAPAERLLRDLLGELDGQGNRAFGDALDMALATMACHAAIRAGDYLSPEECAALLTQLDAVDDFGGHCPHGRPVAFSLPFSELERRLGR